MRRRKRWTNAETADFRAAIFGIVRPGNPDHLVYQRCVTEALDCTDGDEPAAAAMAWRALGDAMPFG